MKLELFHRWECPFSKKVRDQVESLGLEEQITYRDIEGDPANLEELKRLTQDNQVPCLVIDGQPLLESDEIISWLDSNADRLGDQSAA